MHLKALTLTTLAALAVMFFFRRRKAVSVGTASSEKACRRSDESRYDIYDFMD